MACLMKGLREGLCELLVCHAVGPYPKWLVGMVGMAVNSGMLTA